MVSGATDMVLNRLLHFLPEETLARAVTLSKSITSLPIQNLIRTHREVYRGISQLAGGGDKFLFRREHLPELRRLAKQLVRHPHMGSVLLEHIKAITQTELPKSLRSEAYKIIQATGRGAMGFRSSVAQLHRMYRKLVKSGMKPAEALRKIMKIDQRLAMGTLPSLLPQVAKDIDLIKRLPRKTRIHIKAVSAIPIISGTTSLLSMIPPFSKYMSPYVAGSSFPATLILLGLHRPYGKMKVYPTVLAALAAGVPIAEAIIRKLTGAARKS